MELGVTGGRSKELNASQHADKELFREGDRRPEREKESWRESPAARRWHPSDLQCCSRDMSYEVKAEEPLKSI
jgi:hypothetical protein